MAANDNQPEPSVTAKLFWFVALWLAGVAVLGVIAYLIRLAIF